MKDEYKEVVCRVRFIDGVHAQTYLSDVEIVRCKDCKYWGEDGYRNGCKYATCIMQEQDYCSMAERRTE